MQSYQLNELSMTPLAPQPSERMLPTYGMHPSPVPITLLSIVESHPFGLGRLTQSRAVRAVLIAAPVRQSTTALPPPRPARNPS